MMPRLKALILRLLHEHRVMTMATLRPDGWPQATMVGYLNDGFLSICFVARRRRNSPISARPARFDRDGGMPQIPCRCGALSLAGHASEVSDRSELQRDCRTAAAKVSGICRLACAAGAARRPTSAYCAGAKAHAGRASTHRAGHHLGVGLRARLRPQRARSLFGTRSRCASRDPEPPLERGRRRRATDAPAAVPAEPICRAAGYRGRRALAAAAVRALRPLAPVP